MSALLHDKLVISTTLTVNSRLSRHLMQGHDQWQLAQGKSSWETPAVLPLNAWLKQQWQQLSFHFHGDVPILLSDIQAQALWEKVIRESEYGAALLNISATAKAAQQAWRLLKQWCLPLDALEQDEHPDTVAFYQWALGYQALCLESNYLDEAELTTWVAEQLNALDKDISWLGFDELTPQHQVLMQAQQAAGVSAAQLELPQHEAQACLLPCADSRAEIEAAALWLRDLLEKGAQGPIGVVVPDLSGLRADIERIFDEVLTPTAATDLSNSIHRPFNLSLGTALAELPMIHAGLNLLSLLQGYSPLGRWSQLLLSPFIRGAGAEMAARAQLDARLRRHGEAKLSLRQVFYWADKENSSSGDAPLAQLMEMLIALSEQYATMPNVDSAVGWSERLQTVLQIVGWPGERELDSTAFQTAQAWKALLTQLGSLGQVLPLLSYSEVLRHLRQLAAVTLFQPQNRSEPVQILGVLEAVGLEFSHCWVMGLHDGVWPPAPQPNAFLPIELQRELQMPHATAERELAYAQRISERLFAAAPQVIISYPQREGDSERRPSPLLAGLKNLSRPSWLNNALPTYRRKQYTARRIENYADWQAPVLGGAQAKGGTSIFKDQAACPFRAFARHRLGAEGLAEPVTGLDAADRGNLVHNVLERFWTQIADQETLEALSAEELQLQVDAVVQEVVAVEAEMFPLVFTERFSQLEKARLGRLTVDWLQRECERESFSVAGVEVSRTINVGGLLLDAKADRIDRLKSGGDMIIDYKTGDPKVHAWFGTRPDEPQLPLYAISHGQEVSAIAFARLNPAGNSFRGLSRHANEAEGIVALEESKYDLGKEDWSALLDEWRNVLTDIAQDFRQGIATVDPKDGHKTCQYCECGPLCRITELNGSGLDEAAGREAEDE
ncbi:PD-(D/E)XK nuclease family protein [Pseudomonadota bacterium]